jgi:small subunit ribosomal protein S3
MGQKVHPYGFRLGITKTWRSRWFAKQDYARLLHEDLQLKESLLERLKAAGVSSIEVDRPGNKLRITIRTSRPGIIIGRKGAEIEKLKGDLAKKTNREVFIDIQEVHRPELDAQLVSESIALQLEKRVAFRRAMRKAVDSALRFGCKGIKVRVSGRLNGAEIARSEWYLQGQLPLHTLRADIDYGFSQSYTTYGVIGVKVWIYKGEVLEGGNRSRNTLRADAEPRRRRNPRDDRGRDDRGDRGPDRGGDRGGDRRPPQGGGAYANPQQATPYSAPPAGDVTGPVVQQAPADLPKPASAPVIAPMSAPVAPSWKQEQQKPADAVETPAVEQAPVDTAIETPKESSE